jgi:hypothetical protein
MPLCLAGLLATPQSASLGVRHGQLGSNTCNSKGPQGGMGCVSGPWSACACRQSGVARSCGGYCYALPGSAATARVTQLYSQYHSHS